MSDTTKPSIECCAQCGEPKDNPDFQPGDEAIDGWPACGNPSCEAFGQPTANAWFRTTPPPPSETAIERLPEFTPPPTRRKHAAGSIHKAAGWAFAEGMTREQFMLAAEGAWFIAEKERPFV